MEIDLIIQKRRKALGLTQEQVAEYLGVTTSAVNKWERGSTCPDIALLSPLARLLQTDLNTLFGFHGDITQQELVHFCKEIREMVLSEGFEAGFSAAQEKLREYPNSDALLQSFALQLHGLLAASGLGEEQVNAYMKTIDGWQARLTQSNDSVIRNGANYMLASRAIGGQQYDKAQEHLDQLPNRHDTPDKRLLQASIYLGRNQAEEAVKLLEQMLISAINDTQMIMYKLIDANVALGENDTAAYVAERATKLAETFDLHQYNTVAAPFMLAVSDQDVEQTVKLLRKMIASLQSVWTLHESPLYRRASVDHAGMSMEKMIGLLLQGLKQAPEYAFLRASKEFRMFLEEYEGHKQG